MRIRTFKPLLAWAFIAGCNLLCAAEPAQANSEAAEPAQAEAAEPERKPVSVEELSRFAAVFREVQNNFVEPVDDKALMEAAIHGLLSKLDPHSEYLSASAFNNFTSDTDGEYGGLGVEVQVFQGMLLVVSPMDGTPAERAGLKPGDLITRIDGTVIEGESAFTGADMLRGKPGSKIKLNIQREGQADFEVQLQREVIQVRSAKAERLPGDLALLRIAAFQADTISSAERAVRELQQKKPLSGLILDLRENPGGLVNAAVGVADLFMEQGLIVSTKGRAADAGSEYRAKMGDLMKGAPMVVLIDAGSASAAEIVAGALQDASRALIVGQKSFGKGSVQSILPMSNGDGLRLTTARYYTPSGKSIQARGILPDVPLLNLRISKQEDAADHVSEANLARHLSEGKASEGPAQDSVNPALDFEQDYALNEAINILRAVALTQARARSSAAPLNHSTLKK